MSSLSKKPAPGKAAPSVQVGLLDILVSDRLRALRPEVVDEIAESFETLGQLQPIVVRQVKPSKICVANYVLVAGAHRLEAARKLNWKTIAAVVIDGVDAELAEIDENLVRADLSPAERKVHIFRRKEIYEAAHPETKHGAVGRGGKSSNSENSFVDDTAKKTGRGRSTIARDARHAKKVAVLPEIAGTVLDSDSEIEALSKRPVQEQRDLAEQAKAGIEVTAKPAATTVMPGDKSEEPAAGSDFADQFRQLFFTVWALLQDESQWPPLNDKAKKQRGKALQSFRSSYEDLHDIAKKAAPKKPASKKAASIGDAIAKGVDAWCADEQAKADAAEVKSKATPPAAELPDIPPFLDRRQTAEIDEEAAAIAAEASRKKQWLQ